MSTQQRVCFPIESYACACGQMTTGVTSDSNDPPEPGRTFVCFRCLAVAMFRSETTIERATQAEMEHLFSQPDFVDMMAEFQNRKQWNLLPIYSRQRRWPVIA